MIHTKYFEEQDRLEREMVKNSASTPISPVKTYSDPVVASPLSTLEARLDIHDNNGSSSFGRTAMGSPHPETSGTQLPRL